MTTVSIYALAHPLTCEIRYVGKASNPESRLARHMKSAGRGRQASSRWLGKLKRQGLRPQLIVLATVNEDMWQIHERMWIAALRESGARLLNHTDGGDGASGDLVRQNAHCFQTWYQSLTDDEKAAFYKDRGKKIWATRVANGNVSRPMSDTARASQAAGQTAAWADVERSKVRRAALQRRNSDPATGIATSQRMRKLANTPEWKSMVSQNVRNAWKRKVVAGGMSEQERENRRAAQQRRWARVRVQKVG